MIRKNIGHKKQRFFDVLSEGRHEVMIKSLQPVELALQLLEFIAHADES